MQQKSCPDVLSNVKASLFRILVLIFFPLAGYSQTGPINDTTYIYRSLAEASMNPEKVFRLFLIKQKLDSVPSEIFSFTNLRELNLSRNKIEELPAGIGNLVNLEKLDVSNNQLVHLPPEIGQLSELVVLNLNRNVLEDLPPTIGRLSKLQILELWDNELRDVPDEISELKNLQLLELRGILLTEEQQRRIDSLVVKGAKLQMSPACNCKY